MDIGSIRETFSKGSVVFSENLVLVIYPHKEHWITQMLFDDDTQAVFESLVENSNAFRVFMSVKEGLKFIFEFDNAVSDGTIYCQPMESSEPIDLQKLIPEEYDEEREERQEFFKSFFTDVDLSDGFSVESAFLDFIEEDAKRSDTGVSQIGVHQKWNRLLTASNKFRRYCGFCEIDTMPPEHYSHSSGFLSYIYDCDKTRVIRFEKEGKDALLDVIKNASAISAEFGNGGTGFVLNLTFAV